MLLVEAFTLLLSRLDDGKFPDISGQEIHWKVCISLFQACLRTGDNQAAYLCLEELTDRFGKANDRIVAMQGLYQEAMAKDSKDLAEVMNSYNEIVKEDPTIFSIRKRRAALMRHVGKTSDAILDKYAEVRRRTFLEVVNPTSQANKMRLHDNDPNTIADEDPFLSKLRNASANEKQHIRANAGLSVDMSEYFDTSVQTNGSAYY